MVHDPSDVIAGWAVPPEGRGLWYREQIMAIQFFLEIAGWDYYGN
jgi:hypothetical protein